MADITRNDILVEGGSSWQCSLFKLTGKSVVDVIGYPEENGWNTPCFKITQLVFDDGTRLDILSDEETSPNIATTDEVPNLDIDTLQRLTDEGHG